MEKVQNIRYISLFCCQILSYLVNSQQTRCVNIHPMFHVHSHSKRIKGQSKSWSQKALKIVGVYGSKAEAEQKKDEVMSKYEQCGYGDIMVGGTCWDEIDLVIRPAGECTL